MESSLSIVSATPTEAERYASPIAESYAKIFATEPWNEAFRCMLCSNMQAAADCCDRCESMDFTEAFPMQSTAAMIRGVAKKSQAQFALALSSGPRRQVAGFAWGWSDPLDKINTEKIRIPEPEMLQLAQSIDTPIDTPFFYISEVGVRSEYRGQGAGKRLLGTLLDQTGTSPLILRTSRKSPLYGICSNTRRRFVESFGYNDALERVLLTSPALS